MIDRENNDFLRPRAPAIAAKPGRFALREIFVLTALISIFGAAYTWTSYPSQLAALVMGLSAIASIAFLIQMITRWPFARIIAGIVAMLFVGAWMLPSLNH